METLIKSVIKAAPLILSDGSHSHSFLIKTDLRSNFRNTHTGRGNQESSIVGKAAQYCAFANDLIKSTRLEKLDGN